MAAPRKSRTTGRHNPAGPPYVGALLRFAWQRARTHINDAVRAAGFTDLQDSHLGAFSYPPPDGVRLSEMARRLNMSRQAMNYLIGQLEELGYVERRAATGSERRLIYLTARGHEVVMVIHAALQELHEEWAGVLGPQRFAEFLDTLRLLSGLPSD